MCKCCNSHGLHCNTLWVIHHNDTKLNPVIVLIIIIIIIYTKYFQLKTQTACSRAVWDYEELLMLAITCWVHCSIFASFSIYDFRQLFLPRIHDCEIFCHYLQLLPSAVGPFMYLYISPPNLFNNSWLLRISQGIQANEKCRNIWENNKIVFFNIIIMIQHSGINLCWRAKRVAKYVQYNKVSLWRFFSL